jgi:hypothetical protein
MTHDGKAVEDPDAALLRQALDELDHIRHDGQPTPPIDL